jgi:NDP-sugar pyrophosphorylase family protein
VKAFLLAAGRGQRFQPVTERIPKALLPFLNVPLARGHLARLFQQGVREAGVNLHHLGVQVERSLRDRGAELPDLTFFHEEPILGTAGALRNAAGWLGREDFLLVNCDAAIDFDLDALATAHRAGGTEATLLVVENWEPQRYTPLQAEGNFITRFGGESARPLLYTGVAMLSGRLLSRIPAGETSLVADLWQPMLDQGHGIGAFRHRGPFTDLGRPGDFLRASLESLARGGPFPPGSGMFDGRRRVLAFAGVEDRDVRHSVIGNAVLGPGSHIAESAVWDGVDVGAEASLVRCLAAGGRIPEGARHADTLLWPGAAGIAVPYPLDPPLHGFHSDSPSL